MRVTNSQIYDNLMNGVTKQLQIRADSSAKITSGTRFQRPSQAGLDYKISLDLRHTQKQIQGSVEALATAESRLSASQTMLNDIVNVLTRAQSLAVQQASAQNSAAEHLTTAVEVKHLLAQVANSANQSWLGEPLFSGTNITQQAFVQDATGAFQYQGSNQDRIVSVSTNQKVSSNVRGDEQAFTDAFAALESFITALEKNDLAGITNAVGSLSSSGNNMIDLTSRVGGQINALQSYKQSYDDMSFALEKRMGEHEGVDIAKIVTEIQQADTALQASYSQIASIKSLSLLNYLR